MIAIVHINVALWPRVGDRRDVGALITVGSPIRVRRSLIHFDGCLRRSVPRISNITRLTELVITIPVGCRPVSRALLTQSTLGVAVGAVSLGSFGPRLPQSRERAIFAPNSAKP